MKRKIVLIAATILLMVQSALFAEVNTIRDKESTRVFAAAPTVELYVTDWCPYCRQAIKFFQSRGIPVTVYDIEKDRAAALRKNELDSRRGVPFAVINGKKIHGFSEQAYQRALDAK